MKFKLEINSSNAAFEDDPYAEVALILRNVAGCLDGTKVGAPIPAGNVHDSNGNAVGEFELIEDED